MSRLIFIHIIIMGSDFAADFIDWGEFCEKGDLYAQKKSVVLL